MLGMRTERELPLPQGEPRGDGASRRATGHAPHRPTRIAAPTAGLRDGWLEQRLVYLDAEQARLQAGPPLRRFLRGAAAAYRRFQLTADPAHRFHCWVTIRAVSAGLDQLERRAKDPETTSAVWGSPSRGIRGLSAPTATNPTPNLFR